MLSFKDKLKKIPAQKTNGVTLSDGDLVIALTKFVNTFGPQHLYKHRDLDRYNFAQICYLAPHDAALAMQIAVDTIAASLHENESDAELKLHFRNLLGDLKWGVVVYIQGRPFFIEPPFDLT